MTTLTTSSRALCARDVMSRPAVTVEPSASLWLAWMTMRDLGLRHVVVAAGNRCVGMVDDRVLFAQWPMGPLAMRRRAVSTVMRSSVRCVLPGTDLSVACAVMLSDSVDAVPVVDDDGVVIGIVTGSDVAAAVAKHGICGPEDLTCA